eukprot:747429-Hanusia_phi.AAC.3
MGMGEVLNVKNGPRITAPGPKLRGQDVGPVVVITGIDTILNQASVWQSKVTVPLPAVLVPGKVRNPKSHPFPGP